MTSAVGSYKDADGLTFIRCTGAEYVAFHNDPEIWPEGRVITQLVERIDGAWMPDDLKFDDILPTAVIEISDQGHVFDCDSMDLWNIIDYFNNWKKSQRINSSL